MRILILCCCCLIIAKLSSQSITRDQAVDDLRFLIDNIEQYNPALATYNPTFKTEANQLIANIENALPLLDIFAAVKEICALSNEGHFSVDDKVLREQIVNNEISYLPVKVFIQGDQLFVQEYYLKDTDLPEHAEILSINGQSSKEIIHQIYRHIPSDGNIQTYQRAKVQAGFPWLYYYFVEQPTEFQILYSAPDHDDIFEITIAAINRSQQLVYYKERYAAINHKKQANPSVNNFYEFKIEDSHAYLKLKSFDYRLVEKYTLKAETFYREIFQQLHQKEVKHLIVDLRGNTGGRIQFANEIVPFILQSEQDAFLRKSISWKGKTKTYKLPKADKLAFNGKIYVLINGSTFSAGGSVSRFLKEYANATVIGEEGGARYEGFAAGSKEYVYLPHSNIKVGIPRYQTVFPDSEKQQTNNRGLLPDIEISNSIVDIKKGVDKVLEKAIRLTKN